MPKYVIDDWFVRDFVLEELDEVILEVCECIAERDIAIEDDIAIFQVLEEFIDCAEYTGDEVAHAINSVLFMCDILTLVEDGAIELDMDGNFKLTPDGLKAAQQEYKKTKPKKRKK